MGKTVLVTGASSGIGEATAQRLLKDGCTVYAAARRTERMAALAADGAHVLELDLTDDASIVTAVDRIAAEAGRLDVLVNNAGYGSYGSVEDTPLEEARRQFEVNLFGLARLTQLVLPLMRGQGSGRIVNVGSMGGVIWEPFGAWYHATKFALEGFSDCLRVELQPLEIDVVLIQPGAIRTEWSGIAKQGLLERSGESAYAVWARRHARMLGRGSSSIASPPEVVAETIARAVRARKPRTRYATGRGAGAMMALRRMLGDRTFDRLIRRISQGRA